MLSVVTAHYEKDFELGCIQALRSQGMSAKSGDCHD